MFVLGFAWSVEGPDTITSATVRDYFADNQTALSLTATASAASAVTLLVLAAVLRRMIRDAEPHEGVLGDTTLAAACVVAVTILSFAAVELIPVVKAAADAPDDQVLAWYAMKALPEALGDFGTLPRGLFLGAVALAALRHGVLPRWLGWFTAFVAAASLLAPIGFVVQWEAFGVLFLISLFGFFVWPLPLAVGLALMARSRSSSAPPAGGGAEA